MMFALILELARIGLFVSSFRLRIISSIVVHTPHGEVAKAPPEVRRATHKLFCLLMLLLGLNFFQNPCRPTHGHLAAKFLLAKCGQRIESLFTDITVVNLLSLLCFVPSK